MTRRLPSIRARVIAICAFIAAVGGAFVAAEAFGLTLPRPAWYSELVDVREDLVEVAAKTAENTWFRLQGRWLAVSGIIAANDIRQTSFTATGEMVPQRLLDEKRQLLLQQFELERQMRKLDE